MIELQKELRRRKSAALRAERTFCLAAVEQASRNFDWYKLQEIEEVVEEPLPLHNWHRPLSVALVGGLCERYVGKPEKVQIDLWQHYEYMVLKVNCMLEELEVLHPRFCLDYQPDWSGELHQIQNATSVSDSIQLFDAACKHMMVDFRLCLDIHLIDRADWYLHDE